MKKLITLRGNSGSGKTTIARALQEKFGEEEMRRWWNEKDYAPALNEQTLTPDMMPDEIIDRICADLERLDT